MKSISLPQPVLVAFFLSALAAIAHPGHRHPPGEGDEFDALRADWPHLHGWPGISLALVALGSLVLFGFRRRRTVRAGAAISCGGSPALIAAI